MPSTTGGETIGERLTRLRTELSRVRATIQRSEENGGSFGIQGTQITQISYERALTREKLLSAEIRGLEDRLSNTGARSGLANLGSLSW
jgi:hypothetical protein